MGPIPLDDDETVYRAILRKQWIDPDSKTIKPDAFIRRPVKDDDGLSVFRSRLVRPEEVANRFRQCYGLCELEVRAIRKLGLDVLTTREADPAHAVIIGLPTRDENLLQAMNLAVELSKNARLLPELCT